MGYYHKYSCAFYVSKFTIVYITYPDNAGIITSKLLRKKGILCNVEFILEVGGGR